MRGEPSEISRIALLGSRCDLGGWSPGRVPATVKTNGGWSTHRKINQNQQNPEGKQENVQHDC
jgi:hypothetical protein